MATFPPISFGPAPSNPCHAPARYFALVAQDDLTRFSIPPLRLDSAGRFVDPIAARSSKPEHFQLDPRVPLEEHRFAANGPLVEREGVVMEELWSEHVVERQEEPTGAVRSWDALRPTYASGSRLSSPFLTEQSPAVREAAHADDPAFAAPAYAREVLLENLSNVALGMESTLFAWSADTDEFVWRANPVGMESAAGRLWGASTEDSSRLIRPFLALGTALVRLEAVVKLLTTLPANPRPSTTPSNVSHSVATALSTFLDWSRAEVASLERSRSLADSRQGMISLRQLLSPLTATLSALLALFLRPLESSPTYPVLRISTPHLLSTLYAALDHHLSHSVAAPFLTQSVVAYLFDRALRRWWQGWESWIGIAVDGTGGDGWGECGIEVKEVGEPLTRDEEEKLRAKERNTYHIGTASGRPVEYIFHTSALPSFFPRETAGQLFEAGRFLRILQRAKYGHPLGIAHTIEGRGRGLLWTAGETGTYEDEVEAQVENIRERISLYSVSASIQPQRVAGLVPLPTPTRDTPASTVSGPPSKYPKELASLFTLFDLPPGTVVPLYPSAGARVVAPTLWSSSTQQTAMVEYLASLLAPHEQSPHLPHRTSILPSTCPSLDTLISSSLWLPLLPLAHLPSHTLLRTFFTDLHLARALREVQHFFFVTDWGFGERLSTALFTPMQDRLGNTFERVRERDVKAKAEGREDGIGVGIGIRLNGFTGNGIRSAELRLALKETLEGSLATADAIAVRQGSVPSKKLLEHLSFAILDVPPCAADSLQALAFISLTYQPPSPLDLVLSPKVMRRYARIFGRLVALLRVDAVVKSLFQASREQHGDGGGTDESRFQWELCSFAKALLANFFHSAISANVAVFLDALSSFESTLLSTSPSSTSPQLDFNALQALHETHIRKVETYLLLGSNQAALLRLVNELLSSILAFARYRLNAPSASSPPPRPSQTATRRHLFNSLRKDFTMKRALLLKVLLGLEERGSVIPTRGGAELGQGQDRKRGDDYVKKLLVALDFDKRFG